MNETIVVENGQAAVATTSVSGTLSPASSATDTIAIVDTPAGKQAALKVYNLNGGGGGGGEVGGDYLPLSGGTMTGEIKFNVFNSDNSYTPIIRNSRNGELSVSAKFDNGVYYDVCSFNVAGGYLAPHGDRRGSIGTSSRRWEAVCTTKLNNGADLIVPTEGGTLARIEDIDSSVGDISAALTAILGE